MRGMAVSARARGRIIGVALAAVVLAGTVSGVSLAAAQGRPAGGPMVVTVDGAVRGKAAGGMREFLGIPYAAPIPGRLSAPQRRLAATMKRYWTAFAWLGTPTGRWPRFGRAGRWLSLVPPRPRLETGFAAAHHWAFWAKARPS